MGRIPPTPSNLWYLPAESYYGGLIFLAPIVVTTEWLFSSALIRLILKLTGRRSDIDTLLNISGFVALALGTVIVIWDGRGSWWAAWTKTHWE